MTAAARPSTRAASAYTITPRGPFALAQSAGFAYIDRDAQTSRTRLDLAFCADTSWEPTGVWLTQRPDGVVDVAASPRTRAQVERVLGLDVDATGFAEVGVRDPVIGRLQALAPGLRPPLLYSAYEAAVFCILTARRSSAQARRMRTALAQAAGTMLDIEGRQVTCLPPPAYLLDPAPVPGLDPVRRDRLRGVATAALDGELDTVALRAAAPEEARAHVERLAGIGPFSSAIIVARALGHTDVLLGPITELNALVGRLYALGHDATPAELDHISQDWSPWRTWTQLLIRSTSSPGARP